MKPELFDSEIRALRGRLKKYRERLSPAQEMDLAAEAVSELSNALEELRVSGEELQRQNEDLRLAHLEREQERRKYLDLFQSAPVGYVVTDVGGNILEVNEAAERLLGVRARTLVGKPLTLRVAASDIPRLLRMTMNGSASGGEAELRLRRRGEGRFPALVAMTIIRDASGSVLGYRWLIHDQTARKDQEERLRQSEGLLRSLVDGARDFAILRLDLAGRITSWSAGAEQIFGYGDREVLGKPFTMLCLPEDAPDAESRLLTLAEKDGRSESEGRHRHKNGLPLWTNSVITPLRDEDGRPMGYVRVLRDVTERREAEIRLALMSRRLLHLREEEQRRISRELHDSTAQNLAALCMNLATIRRSQEKLDASSGRALEESAELADRCLAEVRTISYLLHPPLLDEVGLSAALRWYANGFSKRSGVAAEVRVPDDLGRMDEDLELAIFRITQESLSNVHKHAKAKSVRVSLHKRDGAVILEVHDDGRGMPSVRDGHPSSSRQARKRIGLRRGSRRSSLEPAAEANGAGVGAGMGIGMGMGLTGIRDRVRERRGRFEIESGAGGTTVRVALPIEGKTES